MAVLNAQRDFSSGELNVDAKRRDDQPIARAGCRQQRNFRVLNSGATINRAGRRALFSGYPRVDQVLVAPGTTFYLAFGPGCIIIFDGSGNQVTGDSSLVYYPWTAATVRQIVWTMIPTSATERDVVICFPGAPNIRVASWVSSGAPQWSFGNFTFGANGDGSVQLPFYRLSQQGVKILPSGLVNNITIQASAGVFFPGMVGTLIRFYGRQILITGYTDSLNVSARVVQQLFPVQSYSASAGFIGSFNVGDILSDANGNEGEVYFVTTSGGAIASLSVNMMSGFVWPVGTGVYGPGGSFTVTGGAAATQPGPSVQWDDALFSSYRGWPQSCAFDQGRLIFCDIPALPSGIAWSGTNLFTDFNIGANPTDAMLEIAPERARVRHVATKSDEIVLTDRGVWYIPISATNPLKPGSVAFQKVSVDAASGVPPSQTNEGIVFISAGLNRIVAVTPTGSLTNPWQTKETSLFHQHLFKQPYAIAATTGDDAFSERYVYVLNIDGTVIVGKYDFGKEWVGWQPWDSKGTPVWLSVLGSVTTFCSTYGPTTIAENLDNTIYLDGAINVNAPPVGMTPPPGQGPLWWVPNGSVDLMDGVMPKGTYQVDSLGNIVPKDPGEDLSSATLVAGLAWVNVLEPFVPNADQGADQKQRTRRRRIMRVVVSVEQCNGGFRLAKLWSGQVGPNLPAVGTEMAYFRVSPWRQDDNQAVAPPLRSETIRWRPTGREFDPRVALIKDVPGPITIPEFAMEVST
jgi:hypothetical protein